MKLFWVEFSCYPLFFVCRLEVVLLLVVFLAYGYNEGGVIAYVLVTVSSWFMALSWLFAPYMFNPSGFEWQKYDCLLSTILFA